MELKKERFSPENIRAKITTTHSLAPDQQHDSLPDKTLHTMLTAPMDLEGLMPWSSNYTFLATLQDEEDETRLQGVYKPGDGERPLWDFPDKTLSLREFTSYLISQVLGWPNIPLTVLRDGPHGLGSVQLFIEAEYEAHYFNMRDLPIFTEDFRQVAVFDYVVNNADRKAGHCLKDTNDRIWAIDHGLTFHTEPKLRTVIWEFGNEPIPPALIADLTRLQNLLAQPELCQILADLLMPREVEALQKRIGLALSRGYIPRLNRGRNVPFPPI